MFSKTWRLFYNTDKKIQATSTRHDLDLGTFQGFFSKFSISNPVSGFMESPPRREHLKASDMS